MSRLVPIVALLLLSAAHAAAALGAYASPRLVASALSGGMRIGVVVANTDDATARVSIYIPTGYTLTQPAAGSQLGTVTATAAAADFAGAILPLTGELDAVDPKTLTVVPSCLSGQSASQAWVLHLTTAGQSLDLPMLVVPATQTEVAAGYQARVVVCLPPPDTPPGTPGRAPYGVKLLSATFVVSSIKPPPTTGDTRWAAAFMPFNPGVGTVNSAATVETQSIVHVPDKLTLKVSKRRVLTPKGIGTRVAFTASATEAGSPAAGPITTTANGKKVGGARGSFTFTGASIVVSATAALHRASAIPAGTAVSNANLFYADLGAGACTQTAIFGGVPCVAATVAGATPKASVRVAGFRK